MEYLYCLLNNIRETKRKMIRRVKHVACMGEVTSAHTILIRKREVKRLIGGRWEDTIKADLKKKHHERVWNGFI
jgi:hypothetical protein